MFEYQLPCLLVLIQTQILNVWLITPNMVSACLQRSARVLFSWVPTASFLNLALFTMVLFQRISISFCVIAAFHLGTQNEIVPVC